MNKPLFGEKLAVLVANGFCESNLTSIQKVIRPLGATMRIVSMNGGIVNSWNGKGWGLNFAADDILSAALTVDFSMLVIPGGQRSIDKLKLTAHTRRFIGGFIDSDKPVVAVSEAIDLLVFAQRLDGRRVSSSESLVSAVKKAGASCVDASHVVDRNLLTILSQEAVGDDYSQIVSDFLIAQYSLVEEAA